MRKSNQGFTLIELMVVIVIIGVLASLAIPRFTEASAKAKVAEAPRILASFESAYLAAIAEKGNVTKADELIFTPPTYKADGTGESKWFSYTLTTTANALTAKAESNMATFVTNNTLVTTYDATLNSNAGGFNRTTNNKAAADKMVPNFGAAASGP